MIKLLVLLVIMISIPAFAQITHSYHFPSEPATRYSYEQVEDTSFRIIALMGYYTQIKVYNLDHTFDRDIFLNTDYMLRNSYIDNISLITSRLFDTNDQYEYVQTGRSGISQDTSWIAIYNENQDLLFSCTDCIFAAPVASSSSYSIPDLSSAFKIVNDTTRMMIQNMRDRSADVYNLPGKLPQCKTSVMGKDETTIISGRALPLKAYPNPSNGKIRIEYTLPESVTRGEILITTSDGREVKRYRVGNMFTDILIEKSELASGAYFYKLITERGESEARKFVITN